jgi:hypothetical protein
MSEPRYDPNDGRFPDESQVEIRYPARLVNDEWVPVGALTRDEGGLSRADWPWLPGTVVGQCGPEEWQVRVDVDELAEDDIDDQVDEDGRPLLWYPAVFRDASELRTQRRADTDADGA